MCVQTIVSIYVIQEIFLTPSQNLGYDAGVSQTFNNDPEVFGRLNLI